MLFASLAADWSKKLGVRSPEVLLLMTYLTITAGANDIDLLSANSEQLTAFQKEYAERSTLMLQICKSLDDLLQFFILEQGAYSEIPPEWREILRGVDLICGWMGYAGLGHMLPANPKAPYSYSRNDMKDLTEFATEIFTRVARDESLFIIAYDIGTRSGKHPYHVLLFIRDISEAIRTNSNTEGL